ncbi:hypothetical protein AYO44_10200 [Planctomycetaceae bacterium SCGC AG-212-F19]|nr:hypothetical protein AYO44_10200 [Planctomycetaceae bacterium SCGC AG-212-F19]
MVTRKLTEMIAEEMRKLHDTIYRLGQLAAAAEQADVPTPEPLAFANAVRALQTADAALRETNLVLDAYRDKTSQVFDQATVAYETMPEPTIEAPAGQERF